jgi:hypothetical protein
VVPAPKRPHFRLGCAGQGGFLVGYLLYDKSREIEVDDRVLAHLQVVIVDKLRRRESFAINLRDDGATVTMWVTVSTPIQFIYAGNRQPRINGAWVQLLAGEASLWGTLELLPEPVEVLSDVAAVATPEAEPVG